MWKRHSRLGLQAKLTIHSALRQQFVGTTSSATALRTKICEVDLALLQQNGRSVFAQFKDIKQGNDFVREMQDGLARSNAFIALLSPDYEKSDQCLAEWAAAYNADPSGRNRRIRPFRIRPVDLNRLAQQVVYVDLVDLEKPDAIAAVLANLTYQYLSTKRHRHGQKLRQPRR